MPLYEFRCDDCGTFDEWRTMADSAKAASCPQCEGSAKRIFSPPAVMLSGTLRLKQENPEPKLVQRSPESDMKKPQYQNHAGSRPWMISH